VVSCLLGNNGVLSLSRAPVALHPRSVSWPGAAAAPPPDGWQSNHAKEITMPTIAITNETWLAHGCNLSCQKPATKADMTSASSVKPKLMIRTLPISSLINFCGEQHMRNTCWCHRKSEQIGQNSSQPAVNVRTSQKACDVPAKWWKRKSNLSEIQPVG